MGYLEEHCRTHKLCFEGVLSQVVFFDGSPINARIRRQQEKRSSCQGERQWCGDTHQTIIQI